MESIVNQLIKNTGMGTKIISNNNFIINYSIELGRPLFACYDVIPNLSYKLKFGRKDFKVDQRLIFDNIYQLQPNAPIFSHEWSRGHLCPSFIMSYDKSKSGPWESTYLMSNIIPQNRVFNSGSWNKLEIKTFNIIKSYLQPVKVIVGAFSMDYTYNIEFKTQIQLQKLSIDSKDKYNLVWVDENKQFKYIIPNIMYQILLTDYEAICHIGINNSLQQIYSIKIDTLLSLLK